MNSSPKRASDTPGKSRRKIVNLDLATARGMLPYVRSIVTDVVQTCEKLSRLTPEQELLDDSRRALSWEGRQRRYALHDELRQTEEHLAAGVAELESLGVRFADRSRGVVDFPTRINGRAAAFHWQLGEDSLRFWRYSGEDLRRPIPEDWLATGTLSRYRSEP